MTLHVAIQMDPIDSINPHSDTTLLLGIEAQKRGHELFYYTPDKLSCREGKIIAQAERVALYPDVMKHYVLGEAVSIDLDTMDVVLLRQDPPFDMTYLTTTYLLERLKNTLVVNNPAAVRNHPEKLFPLEFPEFLPPTLISADAKEIANFRADHKDIVIKPLYGFGGHSIFRLKADDDNFHALLEMVFSQSKEPWVVQKFLPDVKTGERRIILIDGELAGIIGRIPAEDEIRSNFRVGGKGIKVEPTKRQREICEALGPVLRQLGLLLAGIDCIGDYLTEINLTSPTGIAVINREYGVNLEAKLWDVLEARLSLK